MQRPFLSCPTKETGMEIKRQKIAKILKQSRMFDNKEKVLERVTYLPDMIQEFPMSLLKNDLWPVMAEIYTSPRALSELAAAGLATDPRGRDGAGKSAFFYALQTERPDIVFLLYDHAVGVCPQHDAPGVVEHLRGLADFLGDLGRELDSEGVSEAARRLFGDLRRFHEFHLEVCKSLHDLKEKHHDCEALSRKDTMLTILKTYQTYFGSRNRETESSFKDDGLRFEEFYKHQDYFDKLDFTSAVMFFNNLFLLKERLKLEKNAYLEIESNFFLFIFLKKYLEQYEKQSTFYFGSVWITFQERLSLGINLQKFMDIIEKTQLPKDKVGTLPKEVVQTLTNMPEIYGEFLIFRLQHYLNAATEPIFEDSKLILAVERCLQVMGECFKESDFNSIQKLLTLSLPSNFITYLKKIRNTFSHTESYKLQYIYNLERDVDLFKRIKIELGEVKKLLFPIFSFHKYEVDQFLLLHSIKSICKAGSNNFSKENENHFFLPEDERPIQSFDKMHSYLLEKIIGLNRDGNILDNYSTCRQIVQNLFSSAQIFLDGNKPSRNGKAVSEVENLESCFWCLEKFLIYITKDRTLGDKKKYRKSLITTLRKRKNLFAELKKNENLHQKINSAKDRIVKRIFTSKAQDELLRLGTLVAQKPKSFETNQVEKENNRKKGENSALRKQFGDGIPQDTKECEEVAVNTCGSCKYIQTTIQNEEIDIPAAGTISVADCDDRLLSSFYDNNSDDNDTEAPAEITDIQSKTVKEVSTRFIEDYKRMADSLLPGLSHDSSQYSNFENIEKYCSKLKRNLTKEEKELILQDVSDQYKSTSDLKETVKGFLRDKLEFNKNIEECLQKMLMSKNEIRNIRKKIESEDFSGAIQLVESATDYFVDLKKATEGDEEIEENRYKSFCEKLELSDAAKKVLYKLVRGNAEKLYCKRHQLALDRIKILKNILNYEYGTVQLLEKRETTDVKEKIVLLYLNDSAFQASIEKLLFDCMVILNMNKLKTLWRKTKNLFNGVNLKCVLAHGHPLLESLGRLLDPCDLPSALVEKILQLIKDEKVIEYIRRLIQKGNGSMDLSELLKNEENKPLSKVILECDHFSDYV